jgi:uncharacterized membrane protein (DUF2068 family)
MSANKGLRLIAIFEAVKGFFGLLLAGGALILSQRDLQQLAQDAVDALRLDPAAHYTSRFIQEASLVTAKDLWWVALGALAYSLFRFFEAYGLWRERTWAEWLAVVSGSLYIPVEIAALVRRVSLFKFALLGVNVLIVLYVAWTLARPKKKPLPAPIA